MAKWRLRSYASLARDGALSQWLGVVPWDKRASVRDPAAITWRPQWGTAGGGPGSVSQRNRARLNAKVNCCQNQPVTGPPRSQMMCSMPAGPSP